MSGCLRLRPSTVDLTHAAGLEHEALRWAHRTGLAVWERRLAGRRIEAVLAERHLWSSISSGAPRRPPLRDESSRLSRTIVIKKDSAILGHEKNTRSCRLGLLLANVHAAVAKPVRERCGRGRASRARGCRRSCW